MGINIEAINVVGDAGPDGLREELGRYVEVDPQTGALVYTDRLKSNKLDENKTTISTPSVNNQILFPDITQTISIVGLEDEFRDHIQWREFIDRKIKTDQVFLDHLFEVPPAKDNFAFYIMNKNFHNPVYEDASKTYDSNLLININMINYVNNNAPPTSDYIKNASALLTQYDLDPLQVIPRSGTDFIRLYNEYENRLSNYTGSLSELNVKQRNIFMLENVKHEGYLTVKESVPYNFELTWFQNGLDELPGIRANKQTKYILQSIKRNIAYQDLDFWLTYVTPIQAVGTAMVNVQPPRQSKVRVHDLLNLVLNYDGSTFGEERDETYLLEKDDLDSHLITNRFVNQIRKIKMLESLNKTIAPGPWFDPVLDVKLRNYERTITRDAVNAPANVYFISYKIEKYLDNDATIPVQVYYVPGEYVAPGEQGNIHSESKLFFADTQMKFGRKYIYKLKKVLAILGSAYSYSDVRVSNENGQMEYATDGTLVEEGSPSYTPTSSDKYKAQVTVSIKPSFQIIEYPIGDIDTMFFDEPPPVPEVIFYNEKGQKNSLKMYFQSNLNEKYVRYQDFIEISESDANITTNLQLSADSIYKSSFTRKYAVGAFEIYRMDTEPTSLQDFAGNFLTIVDQRNDWLWYDFRAGYPTYTFDTENLDAFFEDNIIPNQKYYYLFRALTYHNTPSNPTVIYEAEIVQDSDETKAVIREYQLKEETDYTYFKPMKRILKIQPNPEQLIFHTSQLFEPRVQNSPMGTAMTPGGQISSIGSNLVGAPVGIIEIGVLENKLLLPPPVSKTFKIRLTSKHTGKKMDINVTFRMLNES